MVDWSLVGYQGYLNIGTRSSPGRGSPGTMAGDLVHPRSSPGRSSDVFLEATLVICEHLVILHGGHELPGRMV